MPERVGKYALFSPIAAGGMATVHFGRISGAGGFARTVAIKRLHSHLVGDPDFAAMFIDEARLAARIRHPNVVPTLDVISQEDELLVVMEYVHGESLSRLMKAVAGQGEHVPLEIATAIMVNALYGLHAAHEARSETNEPLALVHRDVSPQNILVGVDGIARVLDFGVAKAKGRLHTTEDGKVKGKLGYMALEQLRGEAIDRRTDIYAAGVVLWELLTLVRLFLADSDGSTVTNVLERKIEPPSAFCAEVPASLDTIVMRALSRDPAKRFDTAKQMAAALESAMPPASPAHVGEWVTQMAERSLAQRESVMREIESGAAESPPQTRKGSAVASGDESKTTQVNEIATVPERKVESQISSISVATPTRDPPRRRAVAVAVILPFFLLAGGVLAWAFTRPPKPTAAGEPAAPLVLSTAASSPVATPSQLTSSELPPPPAPSLSVLPKETPPAATSVHSHTPSVVHVTPSATTPPKKPNCDPPYVIENGIKRHKLDCL